MKELGTREETLKKHHRKFCMQLAKLLAPLSSERNRAGLYLAGGNHSILQEEENKASENYF